MLNSKVGGRTARHPRHSLHAIRRRFLLVPRVGFEVSDTWFITTFQETQALYVADIFVSLNPKL